MTDAAPVERRAGRVILLDRDGCVLLFRGSDSTDPGAGSWWFTPGGGVEGGESAREAATRELFEETGLVADGVGASVHERSSVFVFEGVELHQVESFFVERVRRFEVDPRGWTELERRTMLESRWWSADELEATSEVVYPEDLAALVRRLVGSGDP